MGLFYVLDWLGFVFSGRRVIEWKRLACVRVRASLACARAALSRSARGASASLRARLSALRLQGPIARQIFA